VLEDGPERLSRQALADVLGISLTTARRMVSPRASLPAIAAQAVERRRAHGRWGIPATGDAHQNATRLIASALPSSDERIAEEVVWLKLVLAHPPVTPRTARIEVRERYQLFDRDWADQRPEPPAAFDDAAVARAVASARTSCDTVCCGHSTSSVSPAANAPRPSGECGPGSTGSRGGSARATSPRKSAWSR
jgi:hypothetical protein